MRASDVLRVLTLASGLLATACGDSGKTSNPAGRAPTASGGLESWVGKWTGPEGTYLLLSNRAGGFDIVISDLDGPKPYAGKVVGDHIEFERNGVVESLRATDGKGTGMKWLQDKTDCLMIKPGEGFCR